jgi:hypothetical protein
MARLQQKTTGRRFKRERLDASATREALKAALEEKGLTLPRFGSLENRPPNPSHRPPK